MPRSARLFVVPVTLAMSLIVLERPAQGRNRFVVGNEDSIQSAIDAAESGATIVLTQERTRVGFDRSIYVSEDEICFFVFDAPSSCEAALAAQRAGLEPIRVVEAVSSGKEEK